MDSNIVTPQQLDGYELRPLLTNSNVDLERTGRPAMIRPSNMIPYLTDSLENNEENLEANSESRRKGQRRVTLGNAEVLKTKIRKPGQRRSQKEVALEEKMFFQENQQLDNKMSTMIMKKEKHLTVKEKMEFEGNEENISPDSEQFILQPHKAPHKNQKSVNSIAYDNENIKDFNPIFSLHSPSKDCTPRKSKPASPNTPSKKKEIPSKGRTPMLDKGNTLFSTIYEIDKTQDSKRQSSNSSYIQEMSPFSADLKQSAEIKIEDIPDILKDPETPIALISDTIQDASSETTPKAEKLNCTPTTPPTVKGTIVPFIPLVTTRSTPSKRMRVSDEVDYYQKKARQLEKDAQQAKYAALHYRQLFHGPAYTDEPHSIRKLMSKVAKYKSNNVTAALLMEEGDEETGLPESIEMIYLWLEKNGYLDQYTLPEFRAAQFVTSVNLTNTFERASKEIEQKLHSENPEKDITIDLDNRKKQKAAAMLSILSQPNSFKSINSLRLSNISISDSYLINLRSLESLEQLYLDNTLIGDEGIAHLVALKSSLNTLTLTDNRRVTDYAFANLRFFGELEILALDGTSITMDGLRTFVNESRSKSLMQLTIPEDCRNYLNQRHLLYCIDPRMTKNSKHPIDHKQSVPFIIDPRRVTLLSLAALKIQLAFHYEVNPKICITGQKRELAQRLREILERRRDDGKIMELAGGRVF
ncbi:hypothetical protein G9A89_002445 [Geosiphon pyriformis]|nr:hypothetical protein G9A89_002445 [Geosiphon pyriformis]